MINVKCKSCRQIGNAPLHFTLVVLHWIAKCKTLNGTAKCKTLNVKCKSCRQIGTHLYILHWWFYIGYYKKLQM